MNEKYWKLQMFETLENQFSADFILRVLNRAEQFSSWYLQQGKFV